MGGGSKALMARPLENNFFAASLRSKLFAVKAGRRTNDSSPNPDQDQGFEMS